MNASLPISALLAGLTRSLVHATESEVRTRLSYIRLLSQIHDRYAQPSTTRDVR